MLRYSLDTNVCVRILRNRPVLSGPLADRLSEAANSIATSTIVAMELLYGAAVSERPEQRREQVNRLLARMTVLDFDASAAEHAADIKADLKRRGELIGSNDILIAGHARSRGLVLVTGNLREFERVNGLRVEDWPAGPSAPVIK
ncbi:tRNA(fMet)-specific endonuclease VapC [Brevundimonas sp. SH203]|uniref:type II toxin-antitoxin system VapC family toxin n=1 Tax=Brevundimonas sp. SH203 TaxID=345167 RepID=UPI0009C488D6|nr:type II toxin-antitoxin system VapC family toxin [Brevundimonas sp. SH203]GAW40464.1 tRNA(fMet)-specific endonuclease VapC [Brevundimonas sp. SH203]